MLRTIKDPEKPSTLEDLNVVYEEGIFIQKPTSNNVTVVCIFNRTIRLQFDLHFALRIKCLMNEATTYRNNM